MYTDCVRIRLTKLIHQLFNVSVFVKGVDGVLEILIAFFLAFASPAQLDSVFLFFFHHELAEDPSDRLAHYVLMWIYNVPFNAKLFAIVYLILHGIVKLFLVANLFRERLWAFPVSLAILALFVLYQCVHLVQHFTLPFAAFTVLDILVICFIVAEYRTRRKMAQA